MHERPLRLDSKGWLEAVNRFVVLVQRLVLKLYYQSRAAGSEASGAVLVLRLVLKLCYQSRAAGWATCGAMLGLRLVLKLY